MNLINKMVLFLILLGFSTAQTASEVKKAPESTPPSHEPKKKKKKAETGPFVNLGQFNIPILKENKPVGYIGLEIILEGTDLVAAQALRDKAPKIYDLFFIDLYILGDILWGIEDSINITTLKQRFDKTCEKLFGTNLVKDIVLQHITVRKLK